MALVVKNPPTNAGDRRDVGSIPRSGRSPWKKAWQPTPVFLPGESPWTEEPGGLQSVGQKESDTTEATGHTHTRASRQLDPAPGVDQVSKFLLFCCRSILMSIKHMVKAGPSHPSLCRREDRTRQAVSLQKMRSGVSHLTLCHILLGEMLQGRLGNVVSERPWGQPYWIGNDLYYLKEEGENEYWGTMNILPQGEGQAEKSDILSITP